MREYETVYILRPRVSDKEQEELKQKIEKLTKEQKGQLLFHRSMGKKLLSTPIQKEKEGIYIHADYVGEGAVVSEVERILRYDERVIRFLTSVLDRDVDVAKRVQEVKNL